MARRGRKWTGAYFEAVNAFRKQYVQRVIDEAGGNFSEAARKLGLTYKGLERLRKRLGMPLAR